MVLKSLLAQGRETLSLVSSYHDPNVSEDYGALIEACCRQEGLEFAPWTDLRPRLRETIHEQRITGVVAIGWQYLIPSDVWTQLPDRLVVFHDSLLPRYRGFSPVATGMIKGDEEFGVSVIYGGDGIDDGDIILQLGTHLGPEVYMAEAIERIGELYCDAAGTLLLKMKSGAIKARRQDGSKATYAIWRGPEDCRIDWRKSAREIYDLIRAVSHPYPGAFSYLGGRRIRVWQSEIVPEDVRFEIRDPGKIWRLERGRPVVVCGEGLLELSEMTDDLGNSILPVTRLRETFV